MATLSILDLVRVTEQTTAREAMDNARALAAHAEALGYQRFWVAEHHNMRGIASAATSVVIAHIAAGTKTIRVGAGGIMLPNHSPLVIAEQFGTLESLFPGRIDLGLGRAPGTDPLTARALRRGLVGSADTFPQDVMELQAYFRAAEPGQAVRAVPGAGLSVPIWILGSSLYSAQLAAALGLPYAFASHFAPDDLAEALQLYRGEFRPSPSLKRPRSMAAVAVCAADTDAEAARLFTSVQQSLASLRSGMPGPLPPPVESMEGRWTAPQKGIVDHAFREAIVGSPATVNRGIEAFLARTGVDELMVTASIFDHGARLRSFELVAQLSGAARR